MARLLVVDDDLDIASLLTQILVVEGHDVLTAHDGEEGLRMLGSALPDAVLLDVEMPILSGPGMVYRMLIHDAGQERIPVFLLSGAADLDRVAKEVGTPYYLAKPFAIDSLLFLLDKVLREREPPHYHLAQAG